MAAFSNEGYCRSMFFAACWQCSQPASKKTSSMILPAGRSLFVKGDLSSRENSKFGRVGAGACPVDFSLISVTRNRSAKMDFILIMENVFDDMNDCWLEGEKGGVET